MLFQKLQKGLFRRRRRKKKKRVSGEFLGLSGNGKTNSPCASALKLAAQHLENDSLEELTKKLWFAPSQVYIFVPFTVSFVVLEGSPAPSRRPPPTLPLLEAPGGSLTPPAPQPGDGGRRRGAELFLELAGERVKGILAAAGGKKFPEFSTGRCRKRAPF